MEDSGSSRGETERLKCVRTEQELPWGEKENGE